MALISVNVDGLQAVRQVLVQRTGDAHAAAASVRSVQRGLAVNPDDPAVRALPGVLDAVERRVLALSDRVDTQRHAVDSFLHGVLALERVSGMRRLSGTVMPVLARLGTAVRRRMPADAISMQLGAVLQLPLVALAPARLHERSGPMGCVERSSEGEGVCPHDGRCRGGSDEP